MKCQNENPIYWDFPACRWEHKPPLASRVHEPTLSLHKGVFDSSFSSGLVLFCNKSQAFFFFLTVFCSVPVHMLFWNSFQFLIAISSFLTSILLQFSFQLEAVITELSAQAQSGNAFIALHKHRVLIWHSLSGCDFFVVVSFSFLPSFYNYLRW